MLAELIKYTELADEKFIEAFINADKSMPEAERLFSHILNAQHIWISRLRKEDPLYERFHVHPVHRFKELHLANIAALQALAAADLNYTVQYRNSQGGYYENTASDILFHSVNHSTYHRAQVATQFRLNNMQPPATDFIVLKREFQL